MPAWLESNLALIRTHHPHLVKFVGPELDSNLTALTTPSGWPTLVRGNGDHQISLHGRVDPLQEAAALVGRLTLIENRALLVLGLGLGYHVRVAVERLPETTEILVVEADPTILNAAVHLVDLGEILARPNLTLLVGLSSDEVLGEVTRLRIRRSLADPLLLVHPPSLRSAPEYYRPLRDHIETDGELIRHALIHPRLKCDQVKVLILNTGYYLVPEVTRALTALGHQARTLDIPDSRTGSGEIIKCLLTLIADFRPDFVLAINHLGFDSAGILDALLTDLELPWASWFVDSPRLILDGNSGPPSTGTHVFLWDADYIEEMRRLGFNHVTYLPLATDETIFHPFSRKSREHSLAFVGDSMAHSLATRAARLGMTSSQLPWIEQLAQKFLESPDRTPGRIMAEMASTAPLECLDLDRSSRADLEALIIWQATARYRRDLIRSLAALEPIVVGDSGWRQTLGPGPYRLRPPLDYYRELPGFYASCRVNLNITSQQMKTGLNQRIFDVPACGAFLLTDHRAQIEACFDLGREVVCYGSAEELHELARYWLVHDREREALAGRALARIRAEHTYRHRLKSLVDHMRRSCT